MHTVPYCKLSLLGKVHLYTMVFTVPHFSVRLLPVLRFSGELNLTEI